MSGLAAVAAVAAQAPASQSDSLSKEEAEAAARNCGQRRFQSVAEVLVEGQRKRATILLCAKPADSDEQWRATLKKAAAQVAESPTFSVESKAKLKLELDAAIANVGSALAGLAPMPTIGGSGTKLTGIPDLPRFTPNRPSRAAPLGAQDRLVATVPPLPAPLPPRPVTAPGPSALAQLLAQPRITVQCVASGEIGSEAECEEVYNTTTLIVRAEEDFTRPASLRFVRSGDVRAEVELGKMHRGQIRRMRLPRDVCRGVVRGELELNTVLTDPRTKSEQTGRTLGPLALRC